MTHYEFIQKNPPPLPCNPSHITFGGRCLNCGYDPEKHEKEAK